jgi:hypothetical protein
MRSKREKRQKRKIGLKQLYYCFIYLFIASLVMTGVSFSRFSTTITSTGAENTGSPGSPELPDIEFSTWALDYNAATVSLKNMEPGAVRTISVWVSNRDSDGTVSGYNQKVTLELKTTGNLPLSFTLQKLDGTPVALNHPDPYRYVSERQLFTANVEETKEYILTVAWPGEISDYKYRNEIDYIELKLTAVQA